MTRALLLLLFDVYGNWEIRQPPAVGKDNNVFFFLENIVYFIHIRTMVYYNNMGARVFVTERFVGSVWFGKAFFFFFPVMIKKLQYIFHILLLLYARLYIYIM